jgi:hypothetical protein
MEMESGYQAIKEYLSLKHHYQPLEQTGMAYQFQPMVISCLPLTHMAVFMFQPMQVLHGLQHHFLLMGRIELGASDSGQYIAVPSATGKIWVSSDYGATWNAITAAGSRDWYDIKVSATGQYMAAVVNNGDIWASSDYGQTWVNQTEGTTLSNRDYSFIEISDDGKYILASIANGALVVGVNNSIVSKTNSGSSSGSLSAPNTGTGINLLNYIYIPILLSMASIILGVLLLRTKKTEI